MNLIGPWSSSALRFCTSEMKAHVIGPHLARLLRGQTIINVLGLRRDESIARSRTPEWKADARYAAAGNPHGTAMMLWNPIAHWTTPQVFAAHDTLGIPLHVAYTCYQSSRLSCRFSSFNRSATPRHRLRHRRTVPRCSTWSASRRPQPSRSSPHAGSPTSHRVTYRVI
ncbi:phosphoadenosine phosphosulfate reductase family protein [Sphingomonas sp. TX0543]|uniref:phosphoadenosine phosphosulfate reductase domain-containing protein n=1 Tax=Sphingomonas sp. TX0543 TaxID=3399682 RepID=UPI003AFA6ED7